MSTVNNIASTQQPSAEAPWYRHFWPWFVFGLPFTVVVAGFVTLAIAIVHQDERVDQHCYQDGKPHAPDSRADRLPCYPPLPSTTQAVED